MMATRGSTGRAVVKSRIGFLALAATRLWVASQAKAEDVVTSLAGSGFLVEIEVTAVRP